MSGTGSLENPASESTLLENLKNSIPLLEEAKVVGLIEPINPFSVPGYFLNNFDIGTLL
jgi:hydroxypyruvate isomerase